MRSAADEATTVATLWAVHAGEFGWLGLGGWRGGWRWASGGVPHPRPLSQWERGVNGKANSRCLLGTRGGAGADERCDGIAIS